MRHRLVFLILVLVSVTLGARVAGTGPYAATASQTTRAGAAGMAGAHAAPGLPAQASPSPTPQPVAVPGHVLPTLSQATKLARSPQADSDPLTLTIVLNRDDPSGFTAFEASVTDPHSPNFHHFASQADLATRFGPGVQGYNAVLGFLQSRGFSLVEGSANRLTLTVAGTRAQAEQAFTVHLDDYRLGNRTFHANDSEPLVPPGIARFIHAIIGLANLATPAPFVVSVPATSASPSTAPSPGSPVSLATAYDFAGVGANITGVGQKIGFLELDNFNRTDVSNWLAFTHLPATLINNLHSVDVNGGTAASNGPGTTEVLLDVDTVMGLAQGATYVVYDAPNGKTSFQTLFNAMINDGDTVISNSWGYCENQTTTADLTSLDSILAAATASGISVFNASDDTGNVCGGASGVADVPADTPHGTAVGGTNLQVGTGGAYQGESWWNDSSGAGGYAVSSFFTTPAYQLTFTSSTHRSLPDVVADADPSTGIELCQAVTAGTGTSGGCPDTINGYPALHGGTSMAAPEWAAGIALINQMQGHLSSNLNQALYTNATSGAFHPAPGMSSDFGHVGLGSFDLGALARVLSNTTSGTGASTAPGTVQQQSPANGATVQSTTPALSWSAPTGAVSGVTQYTVSIKTAAGAALASLPATTSTSVNVPVGEGLQPGQTYQWNVVACNSSACSSPNATWYSFTVGGSDATITSPTPGSTLSGASVTFSWTSVSGADQYSLSAGSSVGASNYYTAAVSSTSTTATNLPLDGSTVYVRLGTHFPAGWGYRDYTYTAATTYALSVQASPSSCSTTPSGTSQQTAGTSISITANSCSGYSFTSWSVSGASCSGGASANPCSFSMPAGPVSVTATFAASGGGGGSCGAASATPQLVQPAPNSVLSGSTVTFCWTAGTAITGGYYLYVGKQAGGYNYYSQPQSGTSATVSGLPTDGSTVYVRLWWNTGVWQYTDYTYTAASSGGGGGTTYTLTVSANPASCSTSPSGSSQQAAGASISITANTCSGYTFGSWSVSGASCNGGASANPCSFSMPAASVSVTATYSASGGAGGTCGAASATPQLVQPAPGSTLSGSSVTFCWTSGSGVSQYWLYVGTSGAGSYNLYSQSTGTATQATVSNLPTSGGPVYVRLWWNTAGSWQYHDYTYTAA